MPTPSRERDVGGIISTRAIWGALGANPWFKRTLLTRFEIPGQSSEVGGSSYGVVNTSRWHTRALLHVYLLADFFFHNARHGFLRVVKLNRTVTGACGALQSDWRDIDYSAIPA